MGKSGLGLCMAANLAVRAEVPVALFTLEMSKSEVTQRLMCSEAKVESQRLRTGKLGADDWPRLTAACDRLAKAPIYVDDQGSITMMEIRSKARRLKSRQPDLGLIVVDYLQLMTSGSSVENRVQEVSQISRSLKILARDLDVPILAMSQLSRAVEQRHDKRPILSDLRESGSIEQDADLVMFIYRDEYYNDESEQQGIAEVHLAKHRNGPTDTVKLSFLKRYAKFADLAPSGGTGRLMYEQTVVLLSRTTAFTVVCQACAELEAAAEYVGQTAQGTCGSRRTSAGRHARAATASASSAQAAPSRPRRPRPSGSPPAMSFARRRQSDLGMAGLTLDITMSLDGFVAGPNATLDEPLGEGGEQLHDWVVRLAVWRERHGLEGGETGRRRRARPRDHRLDRRPRDGPADVQRRRRAVGGRSEGRRLVGRQPAVPRRRYSCSRTIPARPWPRTEARRSSS